MRKILLAFLALCSATVCVAQPTQQGLAHPRELEASQVATAWLELLDSGNNTETFEQLADIFKSNLTKETWQTSNERSQRDLGKLKSRKLKRVVVYENPPNAPLLGTYAAVEYDSVYQHSTKHFQYIMLHSQRGEAFKVMRHESTFALDRPPEGTVAR